MQYGLPIVPDGDEIFTGGATGPPIRLTSFRFRYGYRQWSYSARGVVQMR